MNATETKGTTWSMSDLDLVLQGVMAAVAELGTNDLKTYVLEAALDRVKDTAGQSFTNIRSRLAMWFEGGIEGEYDIDALLAEWTGCEHVDTYADGRLWIERDGVGHWLTDVEACDFLAWLEGSEKPLYAVAP